MNNARPKAAPVSQEPTGASRIAGRLDVASPPAPQASAGLEMDVFGIRCTAPLTADAEQRLGTRITRQDCQASCRRLMGANISLVAPIAHNYLGRGLPLRDLIQSGSIGLVRAVEHFDPARDARFSTFASWWIKHAIRQSLLGAARPATPGHGAGDWPAAGRRERRSDRSDARRVRLIEELSAIARAPRARHDLPVAEAPGNSGPTIAFLRSSDP